jgi:hypothetical protein
MYIYTMRTYRCISNIKSYNYSSSRHFLQCNSLCLTFHINDLAGTMHNTVKIVKTTFLLIISIV